MTETTTETTKAAGAEGGADYASTLFLPKTDFPMRAGLPKKEPEILRRWDELNLYRKLRETARGREKFVLHDGPPYANGHLHIGHALNKILKDLVTRSFQMLGYDSNYVPGWDCHGLPIEWKVEEAYRAKNRDKDEVPVVEFRRECRAFADRWIGIQTEEFRRMGVEGDFARPYTTMNYAAEAQIARELMKFSASGQLYRGSKPVMWSVVERTALAEAEVEYQEHQSDTVWVAFPVVRTRIDEALSKLYHATTGDRPDAPIHPLVGASILIWTTTPWTIPGNRAVSYSSRVSYGLYEVTSVAPLPDGTLPWAQAGDRYVLADQLTEDVFSAARVSEFTRVRDVDALDLRDLVLAHPLRGRGYDFDVPMLEGDHVTDEAGTGFVHTAPGHGVEDFEVWMEHKRALDDRGIDTAIPYTVGADGAFTNDAPGFEGKRVITDAGKKGDANGAVIAALMEAGRLVARGRLKHQYPHSWRSKKPVIFRNTPQWFIAMDRDLGTRGDTLRKRALAAIDATRFVPPSGQNRLRGMIEARPDWVVSRQRAWGVPITVFVHKETGDILKDPAVDARIADAFEAEGADAWFADDATARFLGNDHDPAAYEKVTDILDVWFDSGSTHAFVLDKREDLKWPADVYLEGSDQHRGWFHSSLLESCGTRGRAPYDIVVTHGFTMDEEGRKMSKSLGNIVSPQDVIAQSGADILRLWVASQDYADDQRIGKEILKGQSDAYRKVRNTLRWMLGTLAHHDGSTVALAEMPELERLMMHRLVELSRLVEEAYRNFDYKRVYHALLNFTTIELSAFYFDVRKDALYCDPASSVRRRAALQTVDVLFDCLVKWLAPILPFTAEEAWLTRHPDAVSVHLELFPAIDEACLDPALATKWEWVRQARRVVLGALEIERRDKRIGSSLEAHPVVRVDDPELAALLESPEVGFADVVIASAVTIEVGHGSADAFRLDDAPGIAVTVHRAEGRKCARSWKIGPDVGTDPDYPDLSLRDAAAMREFEQDRQAQ